jgi:hypothetical protein
MPDQLIEALTVRLADIVDESRRLRSDVHAAEAARRRTAAFNLAVLTILTVALLAVAGLGWQSYQLTHKVDRTNQQMADCTTPGQRCYEEGRARTGEAVGALTRISVYVSQCGRLFPGESGPEYDKKLDACVQQRLAAELASPHPSPSVPPTGR